MARDQDIGRLQPIQSLENSVAEGGVRLPEALMHLATVAQRVVFLDEVEVIDPVLEEDGMVPRKDTTAVSGSTSK